MADSAFPIANDVMSKAILRSWMQDGGVGDYIQSGFIMSDGGGLNVSVSAGVAMMQGLRISTTAAIVSALTASSTNHVFLTIDENADDDVILTVNTSGTAPSTPYLKLGTVVAGVATVTSVTNSPTSGHRGGVFDRMNAQRARSWKSEGALLMAFSTGGGSTSNTVTNSGSFIHSTGVAGTPNPITGLCYFNEEAGASIRTASPCTAGDVLEVVFKAVFLVAPGSANTLVGIQLGDLAQFTGTERSETTTHRICVGLASDGHLRIVTGNGAARTDTDLGAYTTGTPVKIKIVFTAGTNVVVTLDDAATSTTVTGTLPTTVAAAKVGATASATGEWKFYGGAWRWTTV